MTTHSFVSLFQVCLYSVNVSDILESSRWLREITRTGIYIDPLYILWHYPLAIMGWIE